MKSHFPGAYTIDLLKTSEYLELQLSPDLLRQKVLAQPDDTWILIDEIQKLPILLDEVHSLIEDQSGKYHFILTGSSARKLKKDGANLLAGRALTRKMFPLTAKELGPSFNLATQLKYGSLPLVINENDQQGKVDILQSYVETYLKEEIQQEAAVKNLNSFVRFLKVAALSHGQKLNLSSLSRNTGVERSTAQGYFQILTDTLIGTILQPWPLKFRVKEVDHPEILLFRQWRRQNSVKFTQRPNFTRRTRASF